MRSWILFCLIPIGLCAAASPSPANVTISNAATTNMTCSGGVCSPTAVDAVLNVQDLEAMLASGNATVTTTGAGVQAVNIHVNAKLTWSAATTLALNAFHSIEVNSKVTVAGTGGVSLTMNDGGSGGDFACNDNGAITFANLSSKLTINGTAYTLVNSVASLASAIAANPSGTFAFAKNYNAAKDGTYSSSPITTVFTGSFNGLGNKISNLSINDTADGNVGLFAGTNASTIANVSLINESVQASSGNTVGGLVGNAGADAITHSFTSGTISGAVGAGGLIGSGGIVTASGSAAAVFGGVYAGGLVGFGGSITDSWATGNVSADGYGAYVGGLVGQDVDSDIQHSWARGQVTATGAWSSAGGLVGGLWGLFGSIERSYATGAVTCQGYCGGLLGTFPEDDGPDKVSQSWAMGSVTTTSTNGSAGGLVGAAYGCDGCEIVNSYALGAASGWAAGGLVGNNGIAFPYHSISGSYATGAVTSTNWAGGLIGDDGESPYSMLKHTYWDVTSSGITNLGQGAGYPANDPGIKGLSDKKLKSGLPKGFDPKIWAEDPNINNGLPYLVNNPPPK